MGRSIHFNRLPAETRERFVRAVNGEDEIDPLMSDSTMGSTAVLIMAALTIAACSAGIVYLWDVDFGSAYGDWSQWGWLGGAIVFVCTWLIAYSFMAAIRSILISKRLPFPAGMYLFASDFIVATSERLTVYDSDDMELEFGLVHNHQDGEYQHSEFKCSAGGDTVSRRFNNPEEGEVFAGLVGHARVVYSAAEAEGNVELLRGFDPLYEAKTKPGVWESLNDRPPDRPPTGEALAASTAGFIRGAGLTALVLAIAATAALVPVRNGLSDDAAFARSKHDLQSLMRYLSEYDDHEVEARSLLPDLALKDADSQGVTKIREFLDSEWGSSDAMKKKAREAIGRHFAQALSSFEAQAGSDPESTSFVRDLVAFLEKNDSPPVLVHFDVSEEGGLAAVDTLLAKIDLDGRTIAPVAPHFSAAKSRGRETKLVGFLSTAFLKVFPNDILSLKRSSSKPSKSNATLEVAYSVSPGNGGEGEPMIFDLEGSNRSFVGISVKFDVTFSVPEHGEPRKLSFVVEPPQRFGVPKGADAARIYAIMADRAYEQLATKLRAAFFAPTASDANKSPDE